MPKAPFVPPPLVDPVPLKLTNPATAPPRAAAELNAMRPYDAFGEDTGEDRSVLDRVQTGTENVEGAVSVGQLGVAGGALATSLSPTTAAVSGRLATASTAAGKVAAPLQAALWAADVGRTLDPEYRQRNEETYARIVDDNSTKRAFMSAFFNAFQRPGSAVAALPPSIISAVDTAQRVDLEASEMATRQQLLARRLLRLRQASERLGREATVDDLRAYNAVHSAARRPIVVAPPGEPA